MNQSSDAEAADIAGFVREVEAFQHGYAQQGDGRPRRSFHVKSHLGVAATFRVLDEIPEAARHGLFRPGAHYPAWLRISNGFSAARPDWMPDLLGFAVKLHGVEGERLTDGTDTQDFLALNQPFLPADNARQLVVMSTAAGNVATAPFRLLRELGLAQSLRVLGWGLGWLPRRLLLRSAMNEGFHSCVPIGLGPHAVKFRWQPRAAPQPPGVRLLGRNHLRDDLRRRLAVGELGFDFMVQFQADPRATPLDGAYMWPEAVAPPVRLAELIVAARDLDSPEALRLERRLNALAFSPWHGIAAHRPLGNIQTARRDIYRASAAQRGAEPES